jgi:hypothetical protein
MRLALLTRNLVPGGMICPTAEGASRMNYSQRIRFASFEGIFYRSIERCEDSLFARRHFVEAVFLVP